MFTAFITVLRRAFCSHRNATARATTSLEPAALAVDRCSVGFTLTCPCGLVVPAYVQPKISRAARARIRGAA